MNLSRFVLLVFCFFAGAGPAAGGDAVAVDGVLDLRQWSLPAQGWAPVLGDWRFYWNRKLQPDPGAAPPPGGIPLPWNRPWRGVEVNGDKIPGQGFASYTLDILPPADGQPLAVTFPSPRRSYRLWVNGQLLGASGEPSFDRLPSRPPDRDLVIPLPAGAATYRLVLHASNHISLLGTAPQPMLIGSPEVLLRARDRAMVLTFVALGAGLMFGLKYLTLFVTRRRYAGYFWIAMLALGIAIHNLGNGIAFVPDLLPLDQHAILRLLLFTAFSIFPLYTLVARSLYPASHPRWLVRLVLIPFALVLLLTLFGPLAYSEFMLLALIPYVLPVFGLLIHAAWRAVRREGPAALLLLATIILLTATAVHDLVGWNAGLVVSPHPFTFGLAFMVLLLAVLFDQYDIDVFEKAQTLSRDLQRLVTERTRELAEKVATLEAKEQELKTAYRDLETASESKSRFLAAASHDLRQPLHAMSLQTELLQEALHDQAAKTLVERIRNAQTSLGETLNALLDISRLDSGLLEPRLSHFPLQDLLTRVGDELRPVAQERNVDLRLRPSPYWVYSDPVLLYRVVANLVDNAIKHGSPCAALVGARRRQGRISIEVRDTGPGIAPDKQDEIFKEFVQLDNAARNRDKGLGLGLSVVLRLSRLLDAPLALISTPGLGSCFKVSVPSGNPALVLGDATKPRAAIGYSLQGVVALVVDDDPEVREATRRLLASWSCETLVAADRSEALRVTAGRKIDVILADYRFGDRCTGIDVIEALDQAAHRQHPAVIVTGEVNPEALAELRGGSYPVLTKPVAPITLRSALHRLLTGSR